MKKKSKIPRRMPRGIPTGELVFNRFSTSKNKYFIFTLGCQMNVADSQRISQKFEKLRYKSAPEKDADLVIVNACSVRQKAVDRIWGKVKKWQKEKKEIILTGCVLPSDRFKFAQKGVKFLDFQNLKPISYNLSPAYVIIMQGCDNFCSYCAVPYTRGREKSKPVKEVMREVKSAIDSGTKEILLLGQNVNSYKFGFAKLLRKIDNLSGKFTFNFMSSNPHDMTDEIIATLAKLKKWPHEIHLAMQSGDDKVLKAMNRKYTSKQYIRLVEHLKLRIPDLKISTDIIVGFPGETNSQFQNTVKLCKKIGFTKAYIAEYSPREGTAAAKLEDNVPKEEKKKRWTLLEDLINKRNIN